MPRYCQFAATYMVPSNFDGSTKLSAQHRVPVLCLPVVAETAHHRGKRERRRNTPFEPRTRNLVLFAIKCNRRHRRASVQPIQRSRCRLLNAPDCQPSSAIHRAHHSTMYRRPRPANRLKRPWCLLTSSSHFRYSSGRRETDHDIGQGKPFRCRCAIDGSGDGASMRPLLRHSARKSQQKMKPRGQGRIVTNF